MTTYYEIRGYTREEDRENLIWDYRENKWRRGERTDGTTTTFQTCAAAEAEFENALHDGCNDLTDIRIVGHDIED